MSTQRSNVRVRSNVNIRLPGIEARLDKAFCQHARTRQVILHLNPVIKTAAGIDWTLARAELSSFQLEVLESHFACPVCGRWDRWPVPSSTGWKLSRTPFGCLCKPSRSIELERDGENDLA
jgi:hypothetical protein